MAKGDLLSRDKQWPVTEAGAQFWSKVFGPVLKSIVYLRCGFVCPSLSLLDTANLAAQSPSIRSQSQSCLSVHFPVFVSPLQVPRSLSSSHWWTSLINCWALRGWGLPISGPSYQKSHQAAWQTKVSSRLFSLMPAGATRSVPQQEEHGMRCWHVVERSL